MFSLEMPTYEYECLECGYKFEVFQSMKDRPKRKCPKCKGRIRRLFGTGSGIIFKGPGFYATDYRSQDYREKQKKESQTKKDESKPKKDKSKTNKDKLC